jgi:trehalose-phosphatase
VHYRNAPPALVPWIKDTVRAAALPHAPDVFVKSAAKALELRPRVRWNKGLAVCLLLGHIETPRPGLLTAGDDSTDEDMFGVMPDEVSIKVGDPRDTRARYHVPAPSDLARFLALLP